MDVCGTGGDGAGTLNVSTAVTFVVAGCGVPVAKHGNRALSSRTGGADVLAALGVNVDAPMERAARDPAEAGCVFLFAPRHHPSMRHAAGPRVELGTRTIFNLLGPLANPARVRRQLTGVFSPDWTRPMAETLAALGHESAWIVHGMGLDELTVAGPNHVTALRDGTIRSFIVEPEDAGLPRRAGRGDQGRRRGVQRRGAACACCRARMRRLPRHGAAECRRGTDRRRTCRRPARRCATGRSRASHPGRRLRRWKPCGASAPCLKSRESRCQTISARCRTCSPGSAPTCGPKSRRARRRAGSTRCAMRSPPATTRRAASASR